MKKILFVLMAFVALNVNAQNEDYRSTASITVGPNGFQLLSGLLNAASDSLGTSDDFSTYATASYGVTYDYAIKNWFSVGGQVSYNGFGLSASNMSITKEDGTVYTGSVDASGARIVLGARALFHYANSGRLDLYSGIRLGGSIWTGSVDATEDLNVEDVISGVSGTGFRPGVSFIPFGLRGYVTDNIGLGFETHVGAPYWGCFQVNYRF